LNGLKIWSKGRFCIDGDEPVP